MCPNIHCGKKGSGIIIKRQGKDYVTLNPFEPCQDHAKNYVGGIYKDITEEFNNA